MVKVFYDTCPVCEALILIDAPSNRFACAYCGISLLRSTGDPGSHSIHEIDPDAVGGFMGVFHAALHPVGTIYCAFCGQIYPDKFECCPRLVDLAFESFEQPNDDWSPRTAERIERFLTENRIVVENTARIRLIQARQGEISPERSRKIVHCLETIGLMQVIGSIESMTPF